MPFALDPTKMSAVAATLRIQVTYTHSAGDLSIVPPAQLWRLEGS
jgi:hypothetical protein